MIFHALQRAKGGCHGAIRRLDNSLFVIQHDDSEQARILLSQAFFESLFWIDNFFTLFKYAIESKAYEGIPKSFEDYISSLGDEALLITAAAELLSASSKPDFVISDLLQLPQALFTTADDSEWSADISRLNNGSMLLLAQATLAEVIRQSTTIQLVSKN